MTRAGAGLALLLALAPRPAPAEEGRLVAPSQDRMSWSPEHPFGLGARAGLWQQGYSEPGVGGQLRFQPWRYVGIEAFADNFAHYAAGTLRRDHVNGFSLFFPLVHGRSWMVAPQLGACDDFQFVSPFGPGASGPSVQDVLVGAHAGLEAEARFGGGLAVEAEAEAYGYLGHGAALERWTASLDEHLRGNAVLVAVVAMNYYF